LSGGKIGLRQVAKYGKQGLKIGNKVSKAMGGDSLTDMAIDYGVSNSLGRVDPTGGVLTNIATRQLQKRVDKEVEGGSFRKIIVTKQHYRRRGWCTLCWVRFAR
jgi:hypothetical protein